MDDDKKPITPDLRQLGTDKEPLGVARTMDFPEAMREVINGHKVRRESWSDPRDCCFLDRKGGWLTIRRGNKDFVWKINDGDMDGRDWVVVIEQTIN